jgi:hypothetical protein
VTGIGIAVTRMDNRSNAAALCLGLGAPKGSSIGFNLFREKKEKAAFFSSGPGMGVALIYIENQ